jgi:hypothetical protein
VRAKKLAFALVPTVAALGLLPLGAAPAHAATVTTYYVSPTGSDSNSGTSTSAPWQTIAKVNATTFAEGSIVEFEGGQSFTGCLDFNTTNVPASSASTPFIVGSYDGETATISSNCTGDYSAAITADDVSGFELNNVKVVNGSTTAAGVLLENQTSTTAAEGMTVEDSDISGFSTPSGSSSSFGGQIMVLGYAVNSNDGPLDDVQILDNKLHGASVTDASGAGIAGWGDGENITNVTVAGNSVYDLGMQAKETGAAITADGWSTAVISHNLVHDIGANVTSCGGTAGIETYTSDNVTVRYNEVYNVQPSTFTAGCDWDGIDLDGGTQNSVVQYNYTHNNGGAGLLAYTSTAGGSTWGPNTYRYNISENDDSVHAEGGLMDIVPNAPSNNALQVYGNTFYDGNAQKTLSTGSACFYIGYAAGTWASGSLIEDNICDMANKNEYGNTGQFYYNPYGQTGMTLSHNLYYGANTSGWRWGGTTYSTYAAWQTAALETDPLWGDPLFTSAGAGGTCTWTPSTRTGPAPCPQAYTLTSGSPAASTGVAVSGNGGVDYYQDTIPSTPNVGADAG